MVRPVVHILLHFVVPGVVARVGWRDQFWRSWAIMVATLAIDLDHLLADPLYDPNRCSLGTHPLHSGLAMVAYALLVVPKRTRLIGVGLVIHMVLDAVDCLFM
jgi:hypothetical protein